MAETSHSLLERLADAADQSAWRSLSAAYEPLIRNWLQRQAVAADDQDDLVQDVLIAVMKRLPEFKHNQQTGAFRNWLRLITVNCLRNFWRAKRIRPRATGGTDFQSMLVDLEDPKSDLAAQWDREHDLLITRQVLRLIKRDFDKKTWQAFERTTFDKAPAAEVAAELGMTANAVYLAKSRIMTRLRQEAAGLVN